MKKLLIIALALGCARSGFGQGVIIPPQTAFKVVNGLTTPIANASITVCAANSSGLPCSPALANAVFKDAALTQAQSNPFTADANGNYQFAIAPGNYTVTVTSFGFAGQSYQITAPVSATAIVGGANQQLQFNNSGTLGGALSLFWNATTQTFSSTAAATAFKNLNNIQFADQFPGSPDLGAQINNCDTFIGSSPGTCVVNASGTISTAAVISQAGNNHTLYVMPGVTITEAAGLATPLSCSVGSSGCVITGSGAASTINNLSTLYNGGTFTGDAVTVGSKVSGTWNATVTTTLTADTTNAATSLTVTSTTGFVAGQDILIKENASGPSRYAEYNILASVTDATHLALAHPVEHIYRASTTPTVAGFTAGTLTKNWEVSNLHITSSTLVAAATGSNSGVAVYAAADGTITNLTVDHVGGRGILVGAGGFPAARVTVKNNRLRDVGLVPAGTGSPGIENYSQSSHVTIQANQVWSVGGPGIDAHGTFNLVNGNQVWWSGTQGGVGAGPCYSTDTGEDITFSSNIAKNCAGRGFIQFGAATAGTTESTRIKYADNQVEDAGLDCYDFGTAGSPGNIRITASGNTGLRCNGFGILLEGNAGGYIAHQLSNNVIESATSCYRFDQTAMGVQMFGNDARNCTTSYDLNSPSQTIFIGNTSEGATTDLALGSADLSTFMASPGYAVVTGTFGVNSTVLGFRITTNQLPTAAQTFNLNGNFLNGATLIGASNTNSITKLTISPAAAAITGNAGIQNIYTHNLVANTLQLNSCVKYTAWWQHTTGTAAVTYQWNFGGTTLASWTDAGTAISKSVLTICNNGSLSVQQLTQDASTDGGVVVAGSAAFGTAAIATGSTSPNVLFTFNVANTDAVTPKQLTGEIIE